MNRASGAWQAAPSTRIFWATPPRGSYHDGQYVLTVDGFLTTPNVTVSQATVLDTGFAWSDHNPVKMTFTLS